MYAQFGASFVGCDTAAEADGDAAIATLLHSAAAAAARRATRWRLLDKQSHGGSSVGFDAAAVVAAAWHDRGGGNSRRTHLGCADSCDEHLSPHLDTRRSNFWREKARRRT